jgi:hypothetical protein
MVTWRSVYSLAARFHSGCLPQLYPDACEDWPLVGLRTSGLAYLREPHARPTCEADRAESAVWISGRPDVTTESYTHRDVAGGAVACAGLRLPWPAA